MLAAASGIGMDIGRSCAIWKAQWANAIEKVFALGRGVGGKHGRQ